MRCIVERFDTDPVARQPQPSVDTIPNCQGEHPPEPVEHLWSFFCIQSKEDLGIAPRPEPVTTQLQVGPQFDEIIDFPIVDHPIPAIRRRHRLVTGGTEIQDRQPPVPQAESSIGRDVDTRIIGPTVGHGVPHPDQQALIQATRSGIFEYAYDSAHTSTQ